MRKLGSIKNTDDFILAIAGGADVNGTWQASPLIEYYFTEAMRLILCGPESKIKGNLEKLKILTVSGADIEPLFNSLYETYEFGNLMRITTRRLDLLLSILSSKQFHNIIEGNFQQKEKLSSLHTLVESVLAVLNNSRADVML